MTSALSESTVASLHESGLDPQEVGGFVRLALAEDLRYGPDATTEATVPADRWAEAGFNTRRSGVLAGIPLVRAVLEEVLGADGFEVLSARPDGSELSPGDCVLQVRAPVRGLLIAERTALNLLCHLSGVASLTGAWVAAASGTGCRIRDSRKTLPGMRVLQKYAVRCGGGVNQRFGLGDAVLIKDNHVVAAGSVVEALRACRARSPELPPKWKCPLRTNWRACWPRAPERCCWTTSRPSSAPRRSAARRCSRPGPCWSPPAVSRCRTRAPTPRPVWTTSPRESSRTRPARWISVLICDCLDGR